MYDVYTKNDDDEYVVDDDIVERAKDWFKKRVIFIPVRPNVE